MNAVVPTEAEQLRALIEKATQEDLSDNGRYFAETYSDLTRCRHQETGEYEHGPDGKLIEFLWNNRHDYLARLEAPSRAIWTSEVNKDRTGKHGSEVA